jgi:hypothetical protein
MPSIFITIERRHPDFFLLFPICHPRGALKVVHLALKCKERHDVGDGRAAHLASSYWHVSDNVSWRSGYSLI